MSKVAKWIFPAAGGKDGIIGTAKSVVGFLTGNAGLIMDGVRQVAGAGRKGDAQARQASVLNLQLGEVPRQAVIGIACTAGSLVDVFSFGGQYGTDKVTRCVALADHAIDGIEGFYINEVYYPWVGEGLQAAFSNKLSFHFRQAAADGHEPPAHVMANGGWPATDRLVGLTVMWIDWYVDDKVWPQGHPEIRFVLRGLRVYDPRFDPQYGYTGPNPQTWADRSSHRFSRNAKVLRYAYTRGIYVEGRQGQPEHLLIGRGLSEEESPGDLVIPDANLCDEIVDGVARYTANGVLSASQPFIEVDGMFAAAMAGVIVQREGTVDVEAGQAKAISATFTDADLIPGEKVGFSRFLGDNDGGRLNTFIGRYIEPLLGWKDHSAPVRRSQVDIQADGGPRESTVSLSLVTEVKQADRIVEINRLLSRLERRGNVVLPPRFAGLEEGDWVAWQSARRHKGATVRYRIEAYREPETWRKYLTLREIASSVFGVPDPVEDFTAPPPPPVVIDALALAGVTAEAITLPGDASTVPAIRFRWTAPVDAAVLAIRAEVRRVGETDAAPTRTEEVNAGVVIATNGVGPDQALQCRLVPIGDPSRPVLASNWITVSTSGLVAGDVSPNAPTIVAMQAVIDLTEAAIGSIDTAVASLNATIYTAGTGLLARSDAMFADINTATTGLKSQTASLLASLNTPATGVLARLTATESQVSTNNSAAVNRLNALEATVNTAGTGLSARLATSESAIASLITGKAEVARVEVLEARSRTLPNLIENGDFSAATAGAWTYEDAGASVVRDRHPAIGWYGACGSSYAYFNSKEYACESGTVLSLSFDGEAGGSTSAFGRIQFVPSYLDGPAVTIAPADWGVRKRSTTGGVSAPVGTTGFRVVFFRNGAAYLNVSRVKVNAGPEAADWSDETTAALTTARLSLAETAITTNNTAAVQRLSALEAAVSAPGTGVVARLSLAESAIATNNSATVGRLSALEATVDTAGAGLVARVGAAESAIVANNNAAANRLSALEATVNTAGTGLSARVAGLQTAVSALDTGKANASDLTALQTEVVTARGAASSLNLRLNTVESEVAGKASSGRVSALEASVNTAGTGLLARMGVQEGVTASLVTGKADAFRVTNLEVRSQAFPNLIEDGTFNRPLGTYWYLEGGAGPTIEYDKGLGSYLHTPGPYVVSKVYPAGPGAVCSMSWNGDATQPGASCYIQALPSYLTIARALTGEWGFRAVSDGTSSAAPAGTTGIRVVIDPAGGAMNVSRVKVNFGSNATDWSDELTTREAAAKIGSLETATSDLAAGKADATRVTSLEAAVNTPGTGISARLTTVEGVAAEASGRTKAWMVRRLVAGSSEVFTEMVAEDDNGVQTSNINMGARRIGLFNPVDGGWLEALLVENGKVTVGTDLLVRGDAIILGSVDTPQLKAGAVSKGASAASATETNVGVNAWTDLLQISMTTAGGEVSVDFGAQVSAVNTNGPNGTIEIRFLRDGVQIDAMNVMELLGATNVYVQGNSTDPFQTYVQINTVASSYVHPFTVDTGASAAAHTWVVQIRSTIGATVGSKKIRIQEMKR